jgi:hypothetical protein
MLKEAAIAKERMDAGEDPLNAIFTVVLADYAGSGMQ